LVIVSQEPIIWWLYHTCLKRAWEWK